MEEATQRHDGSPVMLGQEYGRCPPPAREARADFLEERAVIWATGDHMASWKNGLPLMSQKSPTPGSLSLHAVSRGVSNHTRWMVPSACRKTSAAVSAR